MLLSMVVNLSSTVNGTQSAQQAASPLILSWRDPAPWFQNIVLLHSPLWVVFICVHQFYFGILVLFCDYFHFQQMQHDHDSNWILSADDSVNTDILEHATFTCHVSSGTVTSCTIPYNKLFYVHEKADSSSKPASSTAPEQRTQTETFKLRWATIIHLPFLNKM